MKQMSLFGLESRLKESSISGKTKPHNLSSAVLQKLKQLYGDKLDKQRAQETTNNTSNQSSNVEDQNTPGLSSQTQVYLHTSVLDFSHDQQTQSENIQGQKEQQDQQILGSPRVQQMKTKLLPTRLMATLTRIDAHLSMIRHKPNNKETSFANISSQIEKITSHNRINKQSNKVFEPLSGIKSLSRTQSRLLIRQKGTSTNIHQLSFSQPNSNHKLTRNHPIQCSLKNLSTSLFDAVCQQKFSEAKEDYDDGTATTATRSPQSNIYSGRKLISQRATQRFFQDTNSTLYQNAKSRKVGQNVQFFRAKKCTTRLYFQEH